MKLSTTLYCRSVTFLHLLFYRSLRGIWVSYTFSLLLSWALLFFFLPDFIYVFMACISLYIATHLKYVILGGLQYSFPKPTNLRTHKIYKNWLGDYRKNGNFLFSSHLYPNETRKLKDAGFIWLHVSVLIYLSFQSFPAAIFRGIQKSGVNRLLLALQKEFQSFDHMVVFFIL